MTLAFRIGDEFLELQPGTVLELEEENPFLQLSSDGVQGEYSLPISISASDHNMRLLGYPNVSTVKKNTAGFEAILYAEGVEHSRGRIKIETGDSNLVQPRRGTINLYYLYGLSDFWKTVEKKFLTDCDFGPDISYPWRGGQVYNGDGFMAHVTSVLNEAVGAYDYAFIPFINEAGLVRYPDTGPCILNNIGTVPGAVAAPFVVPTQLTIDLSWEGVTLLHPRNEICPFPYLHWVLKRIFASNGFKCDGDILEDPDFKRIVILHNSYIDWVTPDVASLNGSLNYVTWNMKNHVPKVKIGSFLIALCNRLGLWLDFDYRSKVVTIQQRKRVLVERTKQEYTDRALAGYSFTNNKEGKVYSIKQAGGEEKIKFAPENFKGTKISRYDLPAPTTSQEDHLYLVLGENSYFIGIVDDNEIPAWRKAGGNVFDYVVEESTDDINTNCLVPDTQIDELRTSNRQPTNGRMFVAPQAAIISGETDAFYIAYNFGLVDSISQNPQAQYKFVMGSAGCHDLQGNLKASKSLALEYPESADLDRGLYVTQWRDFLSLLVAREEITLPIIVTLADVLNSRYTDTLVIQGVEYWIKNPHYSIPVQSFARMELVRL